MRVDGHKLLQWNLSTFNTLWIFSLFIFSWYIHKCSAIYWEWYTCVDINDTSRIYGFNSPLNFIWLLLFETNSSFPFSNENDWVSYTYFLCVGISFYIHSAFICPNENKCSDRPNICSYKCLFFVVYLNFDRISQGVYYFYWRINNWKCLLWSNTISTIT